MTVVADFRDRLNSDAKFAAQLAEAKSEADIFELANNAGYAVTFQDIYDNIELTEGDLQLVQGGFPLTALLLLFVGIIAGVGAGVVYGAAGSAIFNKKKK